MIVLKRWGNVHRQDIWKNMHEGSQRKPHSEFVCIWDWSPKLMHEMTEAHVWCLRLNHVEDLEAGNENPKPLAKLLERPGLKPELMHEMVDHWSARLTPGFKSRGRSWSQEQKPPKTRGLKREYPLLNDARNWNVPFWMNLGLFTQKNRHTLQ